MSLQIKELENSRISVTGHRWLNEQYKEKSKESKDENRTNKMWSATTKAIQNVLQ